MKSDFSQLPPSRSGFDSELDRAFCVDLNLNELKEIGLVGLIGCLILKFWTYRLTELIGPISDVAPVPWWRTDDVMWRMANADCQIWWAFCTVTRILHRKLLVTIISEHAQPDVIMAVWLLTRCLATHLLMTSLSRAHLRRWDIVI